MEHGNLGYLGSGPITGARSGSCTRRIAIITGTRAEFGLLKPVIRRVEDSSGLEPLLIVTGMHLLKKFGYTLDEAKREGFKIAGIVEMYDESEKVHYHAKGLSRGIMGFSKSLFTLKPDMVLVLGDRLEPLAAVIAASLMKIPIAHIHGGERIESGHIDDSIRHAITRFAHIHFTATEVATQRLIRMGEESWRIHRVGAPGLDAILNLKPVPRELIERRLGVDLSKGLAVLLFHPVHLEAGTLGVQVHEILEALKTSGLQTLAIYPNNDEGCDEIIGQLEAHSRFIRLIKNLSHREYLSLLRYASVLVGNSSSGIIEAPSFHLPVVNVGSRNVGREHAENVICVNPQKGEIAAALEKALYDKGFRAKLKKCRNPYGDGHASERIVKVLSEIPLDARLLRKVVTY